jgi:4-oxalocrotonate tautomerase
MPIIRVEMFPGRSVEQKRALIQKLTESFVRTCGGKPESVHVVISSVSKEDWGSGGEICSVKIPD